MEKVHPDVLEKIYTLITTSKKKPSLYELKKRFCPNVSKYKGKILVQLYYDFDNIEVFTNNEILSIENFREIDWDEKIYIGKNKKNKEIYLTLNEMIIGVYEDPYHIYTYVENHKDLVITENGYLDIFINNKKNNEEEFSEETSEEETDYSDEETSE